MTFSPDYLLVTCHLASPLAGEAPQLDALLEWAISMHHQQGNDTRRRVARRFPSLEEASIPIPLVRESIGGVPVACSSSPILPVAQAQSVEHFNKRLATEHADLLAPEHRKTVNHNGWWTKSYRLPVDVRRVNRVVWFARGNRDGLLRALNQVKAIGQRPAKGYGQVHRWEIEKGMAPYWWFAKIPTGTLLMRPLPLCPELPENLIGYKKSFGACTPPYWHGDRQREIVVPV
jgi:hypothetical protein